MCLFLKRMAVSMDEHCFLKNGKVFQEYHCLLNQVEGKSDKFYVIQLLTNSKGYFVWTRWGKNGTNGQSKLEGPTKQQDAEKNFMKKFKDKTKNKWEDRDSFVPVKGKYTLVKETSSDSKQKQTSDKTSAMENVCQKNVVKVLASLEAEKPDFPDTVVAGVNLHADLLYQITLHLSTKDVLRCMQVCRFWKEVLSEKYFWKVFICHHFDLALKTDVKGEGPIGQWSIPEDWFCYYDNEDDAYVMQPFPSMWKCRVVHPFGLDPLSGDVKSLQGFSRSLEILRHMKKGVDTLDIASGRGCSGSEGEDDICVVLFPWKEERLPNAKELVDQIFHFHPEVVEDCHSEGYHVEKLFYHLPHPHNTGSYEEEDHDLDTKPCLNRIFGFGWSYDNGKTPEQAEEFYSWLQKIMVPSTSVYAGSDKFNPVAVFFLTKLAPGWVGGALTGVTYT